MKNIIHKKFTINKKDVKADGSFKCVFATMGVVDKDGDVTMPGFFGKQAMVVVPVHDWNHVPIGKATCYEDGNMAIAEGKINLAIQSAKDWHSAMQFDLDEANGDPLMEWSYGFKTLDGGSVAGQMNEARVRFLQPLADGSPGCKIYEVSPVLVGAGEKTRTLQAKDGDADPDAAAEEQDSIVCPECGTTIQLPSNGDDGEEGDPSDAADSAVHNQLLQGGPKRFSDEASRVLAAAERLVERGESLAGLRAKEGREMSAVNRERLAVLAASLVKAAQGMTALVAPKVKDAVQAEVSHELAVEVARALRIRAGIQA